MLVNGEPRATSPPSFAGLGGEQRFRDEVARVTAGADATGRWTDALRPLLHAVVDYDAAWLGRLDVASGRYLPLLEDGDVAPLRALFADDVAAVELRQLGFRRPGWPMLVHRIVGQLEDLRGWRTYIVPAGFHDGLGVGLITAAGRHVGFLALLTYRHETATAMAAALLNAVTPAVADAVERAGVPRAAD